MAITAKTLRKVDDLCLELRELCVIVDRAIKVDGTSAFYGNKDTAALRRKSMDLTRALADLRRVG